MSLLEVDNLKTYFDTEHGEIRAVDGVSFSLQRGEVLGVVGESGSGKSVTQLSLMGLIPRPPGRIAGGHAFFAGQDLLTLDDEAMRSMRGDRISMIFQDPMTSLNPFLRVSRQLTEVLLTHRDVSKRDAKARALEMLRRVGIPDAERRFHQYPHEFSGGMRQRVMIAMALMCDPELLIADEPTTALDVTIQAQILELIRALRDDFGTSIILITHDLGVVAGLADRVIVMYGGRIMEEAPTRELFARPAHPYTMGLLSSIPRLDTPLGQPLVSIPGMPPDLSQPPEGCPFHPRCPAAEERCRGGFPEAWRPAEGHRVYCWRPELLADHLERLQSRDDANTSISTVTPFEALAAVASDLPYSSEMMVVNLVELASSVVSSPEEEEAWSADLDALSDDLDGVSDDLDALSDDDGVSDDLDALSDDLAVISEGPRRPEESEDV